MDDYKKSKNYYQDKTENKDNDIIALAFLAAGMLQSKNYTLSAIPRAASLLLIDLKKTHEELTK